MRHVKFWFSCDVCGYRDTYDLAFSTTRPNATREAKAYGWKITENKAICKECLKEIKNDFTSKKPPYSGRERSDV